ncbi:MAG: hypothetical protein KHX55_05175 [Proteobacteria bacterium]|nr:hypothetical protein [Pseudomonadota bacterium]
MFERARAHLGIEKNSKFVERVLFLSFPTAMVFVTLAAFRLVDPLWAIISLAAVVMFNIILLFPLTFELQRIKKYITALAQGETFDETAMTLSEEDAKDIVEAVNTMHRFWAQKTDMLEAQTISDTAVLDSLPDPIMMIDRSGNILGANLSARTSFGKNITSKNIEKVFDSNNFINAAKRVIQKESKSENLIFYVKKPVEQKLYAHIKQLPWLSKGKAVAVVSVYDLTKSMKIEKMQSDFVANASHELRTPLAIISGFIETLQTTAKNDAEAQDKFLGIMRDQADYMSSLIEDLLSLSRIELKQDQRPGDKVDILPIAEDVAEALSLKAAERNIKIKVVNNEEVPTITADKPLIKQVIQNLADNAVKYGLADTDVTIKVSRSDSIPPSKSFKISQGEAVVVSVNNKGPKIEPEKLARLTERFYRMQEHKDLNIKGTGLGLSIAKHIIIRHNGNLTVSSNNYNGTTFTIYLPVEP